MAPAVNPVDREQIRAAVATRYAGLARAAQGWPCGHRLRREHVLGGLLRSCRVPRTPAACLTGRCGPAWAAAIRSRWRTCGRVRRCWTWAQGGGIDVLLSARRVGPGGQGVRPGRDRGDAGPGPGQRPRGASAEERGVPPRPNRGDTAARGRSMWIISNCVINLSERPGRRLRREFPCAPARRPAGRLRHSRRRAPRPRTRGSSAGSQVGCIAGRPPSPNTATA